MQKKVQESKDNKQERKETRTGNGIGLEMVGVLGALAGMVLLGVWLAPNRDDFREGSAWVRPADGMVMMVVPAGEFRMGSEAVYYDEQPVHTVYLSDYWIDRTEVTNAMYALCVSAGDCDPPSSPSSSFRSSYYGDPAYGGYPVVWVDWNDAVDYCAWAGARLPTEAEWEKAARGGLAGAAFPWGDDAPTCQPGARNGAQYHPCASDGEYDTAQVARFGPNGYGLFDMAGNVWEWVADWYGEDYYSQSQGARDPHGPPSGKARVMRSGSWLTLEFYLRAAERDPGDPSSSSFLVGFRCSRSP